MIIAKNFSFFSIDYKICDIIYKKNYLVENRDLLSRLGNVMENATKNLQKIRLVIFDFDGTLMDTQKAIVVAKQKAMQELGLEIADEKTCVSTIGLTSKLGFKKIYPELSDEKIDLCVSAYRKYFEEIKDIIPPTLFPGVIETLEQIKNKGIVCTIATSRNKKSLKEFLAKSNIEKYFSYTLGGEDTVNVKPHPEPVLTTLKKLSITAEQTLVVGDMPYDIQMGKNAGTITCGVTYGNSTREELFENGADFVFNDIRELVKIL